jgi:hypothetical protein
MLSHGGKVENQNEEKIMRRKYCHMLWILKNKFMTLKVQISVFKTLQVSE